MIICLLILSTVAKAQTYQIGPDIHPCILLPGLAIGYFLAVTLCVAAFPVTLPWAAWKLNGDIKEGLKQGREYQIREGLRRATSPPRGMPKSRRKAIHLGRRRKMKDPQTPALQKDCVLMFLPAELRHLIWKECLAGFTIHLNAHGHSRCASTNPRECNQVFQAPSHCVNSCYPAHTYVAIRINPISLFLTCRQIYSEAADHFYSGNNFTTNIADNIEFLPRLLPRNRIDTIRSLRFIWTIPGDPPFPVFSKTVAKPSPSNPNSKKRIKFKRKMWDTTWANLASMKSLRQLRVTLDVESHKWMRMENWVEVAVLEPIMSVKMEGLFELAVPMASKADNGPWDALPCVVRRQEMVNTSCLRFDGPSLNEAN